MFAEGRIIQSNSDVKQVSYGDDSGLYVEFYWREVKNEQKSLEQGVPVFESKEYVKIMAAGDKTKNWDRPVRKVSNGSEISDLDRFPKQYAQFLRQEEQVLEGTPVLEWSQITRSDAAMLKSLGIHTIQQLASIGDHSLTFNGARMYRDMAKTWLEKAGSEADSAKWAKEKSELQDQITALKNQMQGLMSNGIVSQEAMAPPKRGPKPKVKHEDLPTTNSTSG